VSGSSPELQVVKRIFCTGRVTKTVNYTSMFVPAYGLLCEGDV